jgi:hypothetical protein
MPGWPISETRGESIKASGMQITPVGRVFQVRWPKGGFILHRPVAIEVRQGDLLHRVPIRDTTLRVTAALMLAGLVVVVIGSSWMRRAKSRSKGGK